MPLTHAQTRRLYNRLGRFLDSQAFYEDRALDALVLHGDFDHAGSVAELGCGTGRLALRLLREQLPATSSYLGIDVSPTMVAMTRKRLSNFQERATIVLSDGSLQLPLPDHAVDRLVATYVFDLLSEEDMRSAVAEAHRVLAAQGRLCLVSLSEANRFSSRLICSIWNRLYRLHAPLVGGCRPIHLLPLFDQRDWTIIYHTVVVQFGVPSEVIIAAPKNDRL